MRIAIHAGTLRGAGSGAVGRNLVRELAVAAGGHRFLVFLPEEWRALPGLGPGDLGPRVEVVATRPGLGRKLWTENVTLRRELRRFRADALLSLTDTSLPACPVPHLLLVHQANLAYEEREWGFEAPFASRARFRLMETYLRATLRTVTRLTVQTEDMKARIARRFRFAPEDIAVVPSAVEPATSLDGSEPVGGPPFVVSVASASPHKNHAVLAPMMAALRDGFPDLVCRVTVTAAEVPALAGAARRLGVFDRFVFEGRVPPERAQRLLRDARAAVLPSLLESFGLGYYEAMSLGTPVVAADRPFAREACGDAAGYADPSDGGSYAREIGALLRDEGLARRRAQAGLARFASVRRPWSKVAEDYLALLRDVAASPS